MTQEAQETGGEQQPQSVHERMLGFLEPEEPKKKKPPEGSEVVDDQTTDDDIEGSEDDFDHDEDLEEDPEGATDDEDEWDEDDYEEDPAEPGDEDDDTSLWTVKVDGEEIQVDEDELVKGYSRQAHFTRSMQALRQREKEFEGESVAVSQEREAYKVLLTRLHAKLTEMDSGRTAEDWQELERTDPLGYVTERQKEQERQDQLRDLEAEHNQTLLRQQAEAAKALEDLQITENEKLLKVLPAWEKPELRSKETKRMMAYAKSLGYSDDELAQVVDHRLILVLRDAALGARVKAEKGNLKGKRRGTKPAKPGSGKGNRRTQPRQRKAARQSRERLSETGRVEDAAQALRHLL